MAAIERLRRRGLACAGPRVAGEPRDGVDLGRPRGSGTPWAPREGSCPPPGAQPSPLRTRPELLPHTCPLPASPALLTQALDGQLRLGGGHAPGAQPTCGLAADSASYTHPCSGPRFPHLERCSHCPHAQGKVAQMVLEKVVASSLQPAPNQTSQLAGPLPQHPA